MHKNLKLALDLSPYLRYLHISYSYTKDMGNRKNFFIIQAAQWTFMSSGQILSDIMCRTNKFAFNGGHGNGGIGFIHCS
jgi:hypothetical protein